MLGKVLVDKYFNLISLFVICSEQFVTSANAAKLRYDNSQSKRRSFSD